MSALLIFEQINKALAKTSMLLVCVIIITLLTTSCATAPTKPTTSIDTTANTLATKEKSGNETKENNMDKIECRDVIETGSLLKRKICEYKETWAAIDKENRKKTEAAFTTFTAPSGIISGMSSGQISPISPP
jgi:hypothetical protein